MSQGVPSSFLDLILSAKAGIIILNVISPSHPKMSITSIEIKFNQASSRIEYLPFYEIEVDDLILNSSGRNDFDEEPIRRNEGISFDFKKPEGIEDIMIIISIFEDELMLDKNAKIKVVVLINDDENIIELNSNNSFSNVLHASI